jgi:hypothetical protein
MAKPDCLHRLNDKRSRELRARILECALTFAAGQYKLSYLSVTVPFSG